MLHSLMLQPSHAYACVQSLMMPLVLLAGAPFPAAATLGSTAAAAAGTAAAATNGAIITSRRPLQMPDEHIEADARLRYAMAWQLLMAHSEDDAPDPAGGAAAAAAVAAAQGAAANKQFTISRWEYSHLAAAFVETSAANYAVHHI
jgi:hypothetical protein